MFDWDTMILLCYENLWFTNASDRQYERLREALECGWPPLELAVIIWSGTEGECDVNEIKYAIERASARHYAMI